MAMHERTMPDPWATAISAGPNESGQAVTFVVTNDNNSLFSLQPTVNPAGVLLYTPADNQFGSAVVSVDPPTVFQSENLRHFV